MSMKELNLYDTIYPVYYLSKLLGLVQFRITGKRGYEQIKLEHRYIIILQLIFIISPITYGIYLLTEVQTKPDVGGTVFRAQGYFSLPITVIILVSFVMRRQLIVSSISDLLEVDRTLRSIGIMVSYKYDRRFAIIQMLFFTVIFLWKAVLQLFSSSKVLVIVNSILNSFGYISTVTLCQYFNIVALMRQRYIWINRKLIYLRKINNNEADLVYPNDFFPIKRTNHMKFVKPDVLQELELLNRVHNILHNISTKVMQAYGVQLLFIIAMQFVTIIIQLLNSYKIINNQTATKRNMVNGILTLVNFLLHTSKIFAVCSISANTVAKVIII